MASEAGRPTIDNGAAGAISLHSRILSCDFAGRSHRPVKNPKMAPRPPVKSEAKGVHLAYSASRLLITRSRRVRNRQLTDTEPGSGRITGNTEVTPVVSVLRRLASRAYCSENASITGPRTEHHPDPKLLYCRSLGHAPVHEGGCTSSQIFWPQGFLW